MTATIELPYGFIDTAVEKLNGAIELIVGLKIGSWAPRPPVPDVPAHLPDNVERAFRQAEEMRLGGFAEPSGSQYRKALELALKVVDSNLTGNLHNRIGALQKSGKLTETMSNFAHRIRSLGNEATHEIPETPVEEVPDIAIFTKLFLMYQFTLPGMLPEKNAAPDAASPPQS
ncbi:DUF4145 domain-containing protein [Robbsia sp. KACC 23696]|uniref:DUF4145 domain-containing protein n=1 Tax=Robbsia sp. KACC 23696 TaxID=3149231 RepID=UPI00325B1ED2